MIIDQKFLIPDDYSYDDVDLMTRAAIGEWNISSKAINYNVFVDDSIPSIARFSMDMSNIDQLNIDGKILFNDGVTLLQDVSFCFRNKSLWRCFF